MLVVQNVRVNLSTDAIFTLNTAVASVRYLCCADKACMKCYNHFWNFASSLELVQNIAICVSTSLAYFKTMSKLKKFSVAVLRHGTKNACSKFPSQSSSDETMQCIMCCRNNKYCAGFHVCT